MYRTKNEMKCCDVAFLYERLSRDDELDGESNSIAKTVHKNSPFL